MESDIAPAEELESGMLALKSLRSHRYLHAKQFLCSAWVQACIHREAALVEIPSGDRGRRRLVLVFHHK